MAKEQNLATQEKLGDGINRGDMSVIDEVFAPDVIDHDPAPDQGPGPQGFKDFFAALSTAFPDAELTVEQLVADDENVAIAYTLRGTHQGEFQGVAPTGNSIEVRGMQIARFEDGKIVERWGSTDELGVMRQLDAVPAG